MDPLLVIANADAGSADRQRVEAALAVLRSAADVEVCHTGNPGELDGVLQRAGTRKLVVTGGDGSLHAVIAALHRRHEIDRHSLGLIPLGTGNDFARAVGLPLDAEDAARVVLRGRVRAMDLLVDELGEVVVNAVHAGASATASRRGARWKERLGKAGLGVLGYPVGAALAAVSPPIVRVRLSVDGEVVTDLDRRVLMVAVGNGASVGGGTEITPGADPSDGLADVMVSFAHGPLQRVAYAARLRRGEHPERGDVRYLRGKEISLVGESFFLAADGEVSGPERRRTWHVEPAAYTLSVP